MSRSSNERVVYRSAAGVAVLTSFATLLVDNEEVEVALFMATAVIAGLLCFDTAMNRRLRSFAPWALLSLAPVLKTVPSVWYQVRSEGGLLFERYDHAGSLLFGASVLAATVLLSRPSAALGREATWFDTGVIAGSALTTGLAGTSVAFLFDRDFGSATAGRVLESPTWFVIGALLAATVLAASHAPSLSPSLTLVLVAAAVTAGLLAFAVAGRDFDRGWWALLYAAFAVSAAASNSGSLGVRDDRTRRSSSGTTIAMVAGLVAAAAAISARSDRTSWAPGWALLGLTSLAMFALAMASRPAGAGLPDRRRGSGDPQDIGINDAERASQAKARALQALGAADESSATKFVPAPEPVEPSSGQSSQVADSSPAPPDTTRATPAAGAGEQSQPTGVAQPAAVPITIPQAAPTSTIVDEPSTEPDTAIRDALAEGPAVAPDDATAPTVAEGPTAAPDDAATVAEGRAVAPDDAATVAEGPTAAPDDATAPTVAEGRAVAPDDAIAPTEAAAPTDTSVADEDDDALSDVSIVANARAAAEIRTAPSTQRHSLAPLAQAHHFDPSTGLLSAAGLQHAIARAFDVPRQAGHVTIMMFTIRDLDDIEREHGRLASAAVTREVAERIRVLLPAGSGARFARSAYAIIFVGDLSDGPETVQRLARVLLRLRAPVESGTFGDKIDVVASMAQCYDREDAGEFVKRANQGLARAVQTTEPTFVAMP